MFRALCPVRLCRAVAAGLLSLAVATVLAPASASARAPGDSRALVQGRVYEGEVGDEARPLAGVALGFFGANSPFPAEGQQLASTTTDPTGWYGFDIDDQQWEFYSVRELNPPGYVSVGATTVSGIVRTPDWIEFSAPLAGQDLSGNKFWDRSEVSHTPTPTVTPTATATVPPGPWLFEGRVLQGEPGDESHPLPGVMVEVYGANSAFPNPGALLRETVTDAMGFSALEVGYGTGQNEPYINRTVVRFNLRFIPPGTQVDSAKLDMSLVSGGGPALVPVAVFPLDTAWNEAGVTWNNQPGAVAPEVDQLPVPTAPGVVIQWNVRALVLDWVDDPERNYGLVLRGPETGTFWQRTFASREAQTFCPRLSLVVGGVVPTPTPTNTPTPSPTPAATGGCGSGATARPTGARCSSTRCPSTSAPDRYSTMRARRSPSPSRSSRAFRPRRWRPSVAPTTRASISSCRARGSSRGPSTSRPRSTPTPLWPRRATATTPARRPRPR